MASEKQIQANRTNALLSRGPKTPKGKAKASQNALKHGLLSQQMILPGEKQRDYENLHSSLIETLQPRGELERLLVDKIVVMAWRLKRCIYSESEMFARQRQPLNSYFEGLYEKKMANMSRYEASLSRYFYRAIKQLQELQELRKQTEVTTKDPLLQKIGFVW